MHATLGTCSRREEAFTVGHKSQLPHLTRERLCRLYVWVCALCRVWLSFFARLSCHFAKMDWFPSEKNNNKKTPIIPRRREPPAFQAHSLHWPALCVCSLNNSSRNRFFERRFVPRHKRTAQKIHRFFSSRLLLFLPFFFFIFKMMRCLLLLLCSHLFSSLPKSASQGSCQFWKVK